MVAISIIIIIIAALLALVVLAQNPKGGGLAAGFTGASQIGGVQRTADFLEKGTWTLAASLMALCLVSASMQSGPAQASDLDTPIEDVTPQQPVDPSTVAPADSTNKALQPTDPI
ncbi:MAG: preprotein translocase subunit SecG [Flavobacteriales bacterium]|nr:preprotein translocase subunit SecG [Flavobacteriales bacterium]MBK9288040.1 preprotein translocase subunit SecG [Flavobacteriales bacterium]MBL0036945.1 preprotein translocase subunit SecG [Flavobacteriales bacterium]